MRALSTRTWAPSAALRVEDSVIERRTTASTFERTSREVRFNGTDSAGGTGVVDTRRATELHARLLKLARVLGKDFDLKLEAGDRWAYEFDANRITYPASELLGRDELSVMGLICHELAHRRYTLLVDRGALQNPAFHYLWNVVEDVRINRMIGERCAGVPRMMKSLYRDFTDIDARRDHYAAAAAKGYQRSRAEQFGQAAIYAWATDGQRDPLIEDDAVHAALDEAAPHLKEATRLPRNVDLRFDDLTESEVRLEAAASFRVVRDELWPIYRELLDADIDDRSVPEEAPPTCDEAGDAGDAGESDETDETAEAGDAGGAGESDETDEASDADGAGGAGESDETDEASDANGAGGTGESDETDEASDADGASGAGESDETDEASDADGAGGAGEPSDSGEAATSPGDPASAAGDDDIDPSTAPSDPLASEDGDDGAREAAKRALEEQLRDRAAELDPKLVEDPQDEKATEARQRVAAKDESPTTAESAASSNPLLDYEGAEDVDLDAMLERRLEALREPAAKADASTYAGIRTKWGRTIDELVDELSDHLMRDRMPPLVGHFKRGVFDLRRSIQVENERRATGKSDPKVFRRRQEPEEVSTRIVFCIDRSGSMKGLEMQSAREAYVVFTEALDQLKVPAAALMYDDHIDILREFADAPDEAEHQAVLERLTARGGNDDTAALATAVELLRAEGSDECIVFFLTDGSAVENHKAFVREVEEREGVRVVGIGIGNQCADVDETYQHSVRVPDATQLPIALGGLLREILG